MSHPETDHDFRGRILEVTRDEDGRQFVMTAIGVELDAFGSVHGLARKGIPEKSFHDPVVEALRDVERSLALGYPQRALGESDDDFRSRCKAYWGAPT